MYSLPKVVVSILEGGGLGWANEGIILEFLQITSCLVICLSFYERELIRNYFLPCDEFVIENL